MNEPLRLRDGDGAARRLMAGAVMHVPQASRRRAVAFTSAAAALGTGTVALAASATSVVKTFVLCVALGAVGGGVISLVASETIARLDAKSEPVARPAAQPSEARAAPAGPARAPEVVASETPIEAPASPVTEPVAKEPASKAKASLRDPGAASEPAVPDARAPTRLKPSLFEEQRIIESARAAVARGDVRSAFALLDNYDQSYTPKQFGPEALALRIEALRSSGQLGRARALAADFAQRYPHHPLLQRVQAAIAK